MTIKQLKQNAERGLIKMGYTLIEWSASREDWTFGFVKKDNKYYGCISYASSAKITIEILNRIKYKTINV